MLEPRVITDAQLEHRFTLVSKTGLGEETESMFTLLRWSIAITGLVYRAEWGQIHNLLDVI